MLDDLPKPRLAVYIFLEMIALGFALEATTALMRGDSWRKWVGALVMGAVFMVLGVKSGWILDRCFRKDSKSSSRPAITEQPLAPNLLSYVYIDGDGWFSLPFGTAYLQLVNISNCETANPLTANNVRARISYRHANGQDVFVVDEAMWRFRTPNGANQFPSRVSINPNTTEKVVLLAQIQSAPNKWFVADLKTGSPKELAVGHWDVTVSITSDNCAPLEGKGGFTILSGEGRMVYDKPALAFNSGLVSANVSEPMPTLLSLLDSSFPGIGNLGNTQTVAFPDGVKEEIRSRLYCEFRHRSTFLGFYIPSSPRTTELMCLLAAEVRRLAAELSTGGVQIIATYPGENPQDPRNLTFTGKVYIHHEDRLTHRQIADVEDAFKQHGLEVVLRGPEFLTQAWMAWKQKTLEPASRAIK